MVSITHSATWSGVEYWFWARRVLRLTVPYGVPLQVVQAVENPE